MVVRIIIVIVIFPPGNAQCFWTGTTNSEFSQGRKGLGDDAVQPPKVGRTWPNRRPLAPGLLCSWGSAPSSLLLLQDKGQGLFLEARQKSHKRLLCAQAQGRAGRQEAVHHSSEERASRLPAPGSRHSAPSSSCPCSQLMVPGLILRLLGPSQQPLRTSPPQMRATAAQDLTQAHTPGERPR